MCRNGTRKYSKHYNASPAFIALFFSPYVGTPRYVSMKMTISNLALFYIAMVMDHWTALHQCEMNNSKSPIFIAIHNVDCSSLHFNKCSKKILHARPFIIHINWNVVCFVSLNHIPWAFSILKAYSDADDSITCEL